MSKMTIRLHEGKVQEATDLFLPESLKESLEFHLPNCTACKSVIVCKCDEELDEDIQWAIRDTSLPVVDASIADNYLVLALEENASDEEIQSILDEEYKKAILTKAPKLVASMDVESLQKALVGLQSDSIGKPWELDFTNSVSWGLNIFDDILYSEQSGASVYATAFNYVVCGPDGKELTTTRSMVEVKNFLDTNFK